MDRVELGRRIRRGAPAGLLALLCSSIYIWTLLPGVGFHGDTAKFQFVGKVLGTAHPTGYPLYTVLNFLFVHLVPVRELAYRANLLSSVFAVVTILLLYDICRLITGNRQAAFTASACFAFTPVFWSQSVIAEVYTLHSALMAAVIAMAIRWKQKRDDRFLWFACAALAAAGGNHLTCLMICPALILFLLITQRHVLTRWRVLLPVAAMMLLSISQYGYFFWRYYDPDTRYVEMAVPSIERLIWNLRGAQFQDKMFVFSAAELVTVRIPMFFGLLLRQYGIVLPLALMGMVVLRDRRVNAFLMTYLVVNTLWALNYAISDIEVSFIPSFMVCAIYLGCTLGRLGQRLKAFRCPPWISASMCLIPICFLVVNMSVTSQRTNTETHDAVLRALTEIESDAIVISPSYNYSEYFWYFLIGKGLQDSHKIYLVHHCAPESIKQYLRNDIPFSITTVRRTVPPGLRVFTFLPAAGPDRQTGERNISWMRDAGLVVSGHSGQLLVVTAPDRNAP